MSDDDLAVLLYVATFAAMQKRLPRFGEIAEARGLTRTAALSSVRRLKRQGQLDGCYSSLHRPVPYLQAVS